MFFFCVMFPRHIELSWFLCRKKKVCSLARARQPRTGPDGGLVPGKAAISLEIFFFFLLFFYLRSSLNSIYIIVNICWLAATQVRRRREMKAKRKLIIWYEECRLLLWRFFFVFVFISHAWTRVQHREKNTRKSIERMRKQIVDRIETSLAHEAEAAERVADCDNKSGKKWNGKHQIKCN